MYLKSLELFGFKSFAHKTTLNFHRGVTAIVGPNGCGKSNVLDSMRWVLGEQSAKALRGGEMADVIFSGTDSKKGVGMAEVSLNFADCEKELGVSYNEVQITRRVFKDGKSEYLLNKTPCRLKDIHELFMDTGIGRSAYSIMEQGKIDLILSSRPEDRRAIFEEAAGITKYKAQKKEAIRKLEYTDANLIRLTDIIKEVKRQIGSLQRQAAKARRYQSLVSDLKTFDTHLSHKNFKELETNQSEARTKSEEFRVRSVDLEFHLNRSENGLSGHRRQLEALEEQIGTARQQAQELRNQIQSAQSRIGFNHERVLEFTTLTERYQVDMAAAEEKIQDQRSQIEDTDQQLETVLTTLRTGAEELGDQNARTQALRDERVETERGLNQMNQTVNQTESRLASIRAELNSTLSQREASETRIGLLKADIDQAGGNKTRLETQISDIKAQLEAAQAALEAQRAELHDAEAHLALLQKEQQTADRELAALQNTKTDRSSKLNVLKDLQAEGEGFSEGTQAVLKGLDQPELFKPTVLGALANFIEVEPEFVSAIEAALGQNLQAILIRDESAAEAMLKSLTSKKLGRASLAPLGMLPGSADSQMEALPEGAIAWALDRVKAQTNVAALTTSLLDHTLIVPDIETALSLRKHFTQIAFVTLTGDTISREGIVTAGSTGEVGSSVLQRKNQITALEAEVFELNNQIDEAFQKRDSIVEQYAVALSRLQECRENLQNTQVQASTLEGQRKMVDHDLREVSGKFETLGWERENIAKRLEATVEQASALEARLAEQSDLLLRTHEARVQAQSELETLRVRETELTEQLNELRIRVATERQRQEALTRQRAPMAARLAELAELIETRGSDISGYRSRSEQLAAETESLTARIATGTEELETVEAKLAAVREQRETVALQIEEGEGGLRLIRKELQEIQEQRGKLEVKDTQMQLRIDNLMEHIQRRYQIELRGFEPDMYALSNAYREATTKKKNKGNAPETAVETPVVEAADIPIEIDVEALTEIEGLDSDETPEANAIIESETASEIITEEAIASEETEELIPTEVLPVEELISDQEIQAIDWDAIEMLVHEMSEKLESMGPVNLDAIQEYDELEERHRFLDEQYNDLTSSKAKLLDVISKINNTTKTLFADTFMKIRDNFQVMFTELFGGGKANLLLTDETDPLESGIEIIAKPPGKQLSAITLLSGGEKTMTAVALLFSIYMVKPSPFCVLDEMDAPLDESNISRFIKILDRFINQSQFVVITHNKRTIARADVLYGVTMEEHGISKLVGVKLTRREEVEARAVAAEKAANEAAEAAAAENPEAGEPVLAEAGAAAASREEYVPSVAESFGKHGNLKSESDE